MQSRNDQGLAGRLPRSAYDNWLWRPPRIYSLTPRTLEVTAPCPEGVNPEGFGNRVSAFRPITGNSLTYVFEDTHEQVDPDGRFAGRRCPDRLLQEGRGSGPCPS